MSLYLFPFPRLSISPFFHFPFSFLFFSFLLMFSLRLVSFQLLSETLHLPTLAHTPTCRRVTSFFFPQLDPFFFTTTPKGLSSLNQLSLTPSKPPGSFHNCWAGWEKLSLFFCKVFHGLKSHQREPNQLKIPSSHSFKSDHSNYTRMWFSSLAEHTSIHYVLVEPGNLLFKKISSPPSKFDADGTWSTCWKTRMWEKWGRGGEGSFQCAAKWVPRPDIYSHIHPTSKLPRSLNHASDSQMENGANKLYVYVS